MACNRLAIAGICVGRAATPRPLRRCLTRARRSPSSCWHGRSHPNTRPVVLWLAIAESRVGRTGTDRSLRRCLPQTQNSPFCYVSGQRRRSRRTAAVPDTFMSYLPSMRLRRRARGMRDDALLAPVVARPCKELDRPHDKCLRGRDLQRHRSLVRRRSCFHWRLVVPPHSLFLVEAAAPTLRSRLLLRPSTFVPRRRACLVSNMVSRPTSVYIYMYVFFRVTEK
jgi:hypothetical protein